jgi:hypothetical protein
MLYRELELVALPGIFHGENLSSSSPTCTCCKQKKMLYEILVSKKTILVEKDTSSIVKTKSR